MGIKIFNIHTSKFEDENVCAEGALRFMYGSAVGRAMTFALFKRVLFSRVCGAWADSALSRRAIGGFIKSNGIDAGEFKNTPEEYKTFNEFFTRELKDSARPAACPGRRGVVSFPSDGRHLLLRNVGLSDAFDVKSARFNLPSFLGDDSLARRFEGGDMLVSRLNPADYHRFHYPVSGVIAARKAINGFLFSVNPIAIARRASVLWENKRILTAIESDVFGMCAFVEIGATNVGGMENFDSVGACVERGKQAGMFRFGGSCVVTLFEPSAPIDWDSSLVKISAEGVECYAKANSLAGIARGA